MTPELNIITINIDNRISEFKCTIEKNNSETYVEQYSVLANADNVTYNNIALF